MKKIYSLALLLSFVFSFSYKAVNAQTTITTTATGTAYWSTTGGAIVFGVRNNNAYPIALTDLSSYCPITYTTTFTLWYNATTIAGAPGAISTTNGWTQVPVSTTIPTTTAAGITPVFTGMSLQIPATTTYRLALVASVNGPYYGTSGSGADNFSADGIDILTQANTVSPTYVGELTGPATTPRGFYGTLVFAPVGPCTTPPTAGDAVASTNVSCATAAVSLSLANNSAGTGQTYQWQTSATLTGSYTNVGTSAATSNYTINPTTTAYYRCAVTCGGNTQNSTPVLVTVNPGFGTGNYTINSTVTTGGTNFQTFADAINAIKCGITGPVVFTVAPGTGPYNERIVLPSVIGSSTTNTITFKGNGETLSYAGTATAPAAVVLNGSDHIIIDSLNIDVSAGTAGWGIVLTNQADSNVIKNCHVTTSITAATTSYFGIAINGSATTYATLGNSGNGNIIEKNTVTGGYYAIYAYGISTAYGNANIIRNNTIQDHYYYSVYLYYQQNSVVSGNDISRPARTNAGSYNLYISTNNGGIVVEKNKVHDLFTNVTTATTLYGIYVAAAGTATAPNKLQNNVIYNISGNGSIYAIYSLGYNYWNFYHNTIVIDDQATTTGLVYGMYVYSTTGTNVKNNIVSITRAGTGTKYCLYASTTGFAAGACNNNVLYMGSTSGTTNAVGYLSSARTTFANWQATGYDANGSGSNPLFVGSGDYTPTEATINNIGAAGLGVITDINGVTRGASPDPGAYEFTVTGTDAGISWVSPTTPTTTGLKTITVNIANTATSTINAVNLSYTDGVTVQTQNFTGLTIAPLGSQTLSFTTQYNIIGNTNFKAYINSVNGSTDISQANDTASQSLCFALNGTYTINQNATSVGTNFNNFADATAALSCGGITGPVVFDVVAGSGPYTNQVVVSSFAGASTTNTVTFKGNGETITYNGDATKPAAFVLNGADHVIIDSLNIDVAAGTYGWGILLTAQADSNIIRKCRINNIITGTSTNFNGIVISGSTSSVSTSGNNGNGNLIENNTVIGGYYGIYVYGSTAPYNLNNKVKGNTIQDFYYYSIYGYGQQNLTFTGNDVSRPTRTTASSYNVYISTNNGGVLIEKNKSHDLFVASTSTTLYNFYLNSGLVTNVNRFENNLVYNIGSNATFYTVYGPSASYWNYYHNTIVLDDQTATTGATYGLYTYGTGVNVKNNIVYISRSGTGAKYCLYYSTIGATSSNNNDLYMGSTSGTNGIGYYNTGFTTLANWKAANSSAWDQQSVDLDPTFAAPGDYTPTSSLVNNLGTPLNVLTDIRDSARSVTTPDLGAYEFTVLTPGINMGTDGLVAPIVTSKGCYNSESVIIKIRNSSTTAINFATNPVTVTTNVTNATTQTLTAVVNTGTLASDSTLNVTMSQPLNMSVGGTYTFNATVSTAGDVNNANDAMAPVDRTKNDLSAGTIGLSPNSYCVTGGNPKLSSSTANGYSSVQWQQSTVSPASGFTNITGATTLPYTATTPISQTTYYILNVTCGATTLASIVDSITLVNPTIVDTTGGFTCGTGTVTLHATASTGADVEWYAAATGGAPLSTGNTFTTPSISTSTTYYASAHVSGGSTGASPIQVTEMDLGTTTDQLEIQNVSASSIDVTGWKVVISNSYTDITSVNANIQTLSGTMAPGDIKSWTDLASASNYWGSNILWNAGAYPTFTGWAAILDNNNNLMDIVFLNWPETNIQAASITVGTTTIIPSTKWTGAGFNSTVAPDGQSVSRQGNMDNNTAADFTVIPFTIGTVNPSMTLPFLGFGCSSARVPVAAIVNNSPSCVTPVTLLSFTGEKKNTVNVLNWRTATELNNTGFELQRSADGINYSKLAFVNTKAINGTSTASLNYSFTDERTFATSNYYRLKQIDKDGKSTFSNVVVIKGEKTTKLALVNVYPNPAKENINISLASPKADKITIIVMDITGKVVLRNSMAVASGDNTLQLNVQSLTQGSYMIKAICADGCETAIKKFVKD